MIPGDELPLLAPSRIPYVLLQNAGNGHRTTRREEGELESLFQDDTALVFLVHSLQNHKSRINQPLLVKTSMFLTSDRMVEGSERAEPCLYSQRDNLIRIKQVGAVWNCPRRI